MRAALLTAGGSPLEIVDDIDVEEPRANEVLIRVSNCGICHSDTTVQDGGYSVPTILGHEASGTVEMLGSGVTHLAVGDHVVLTPLAPCGHCAGCARHEATECGEALSFASNARPDGSTPFSRGGNPVWRGLGVGAFAEFTVLPASGAVRIEPDIPLDVACVIGCAVQTGVGAVFNTAEVERGATVVVMGLGGLGAAIVSGAAVAGASRIIASDPAEGRRETASSLGATDLIDPTSDDLVSTVMDLTGGQGADYAFDAVGSAALVEQGINSTRVGGTTVMVGASPIEESLTIGAAVLFMTMQKRLLGCLLGACWPSRDIPLMLDLWRTGRLDLERFISHRLPLTDVNDGIAKLHATDGVRTVLDIAG
ncbi:MAG: Zn-dependent alcohol dehydrogenase [Acidimicrobiaceae bacterium]|nr:Zn-dependent alcohol dehydrogenase [Acidimicrobiia bacterium]MCY4492768.1 Zn-dependent alcohol dehydrogenase [Acidimicrobiaceae bacterium]